jgi:SlyX protein
METNEALEQRLIDLEIKASHQEAVLESLQQTVYEQQKALDALERKLTRLAKLADGGDSGPDIGPANEKPPHY